ncbi:hypothetical protein [Bartonella sp. ML69XJBT]|uniref:hypothetical protein n=1 Tax=Bartonella sp. ML69XJBT TaxID=3019092 RepID=UPI00235E756F|nr:hypothetical protein [Bartonella sp. ML69XJBT]
MQTTKHPPPSTHSAHSPHSSTTPKTSPHNQPRNDAQQTTQRPRPPQPPLAFNMEKKQANRRLQRLQERIETLLDEQTPQPL